MVRFALQDLELEGVPFSYGDNVIAPLKISKKVLREEYGDNYSSMIKDIKTKLESIFDKFGIVQKKEETYVSQDYCQFLKEVY